MNAGNQLNTHQLEILLEGDPEIQPYLLGVFASDQALPVVRRQLRSSSAWGLIFNADPIAKPGSHWMALWHAGGQDPPEFFYSFGDSQTALYGQPVQRLLELVRSVPGARRLQGSSTYVCGHYSAAYLWHRARGSSGTAYVQGFPDPSAVNDKAVCRFVCDVMVRPVQQAFDQAYSGKLDSPCQGCCCENRPHKKKKKKIKNP